MKKRADFEGRDGIAQEKTDAPASVHGVVMSFGARNRVVVRLSNRRYYQ